METEANKIIKQPSYRFADYTESWSEKKLGEVGETKSGVGFPDSEQGGVRGIPFYKVSDMNNIGNEIEMVTSNNYVTQEQIDSRKWKVINTVPAIMFAKVGAALLLNRKRLIREPFLIDNNTMAYIPSAYWDIMFCKILFDTLNLSKYSQVGALPSYNGSDIEAIKVFLPLFPEQTAIGSFFQDIDQLISLQQRKLEVLKEQKKTYLELLFPAKGKTKPALRFAGFEDDWKEVKLGAVYSFSQGQQVPVEEQFEQINENRIRFIRIVDLTNKDEEMRYIEFKSSTGRVYEKDIFFVRYGAVGVVGIGYDGIIANNLFKLNPQMSVDNKFMYVQFNREKFKKTLQGFSASTTMPAISFTDIRTIGIYLPSLPEQEAIGAFFQDIDQAIAKQEEKVNQLKESKQTLLRKMFI